MLLNCSTFRAYIFYNGFRPSFLIYNVYVLAYLRFSLNPYLLLPSFLVDVPFLLVYGFLVYNPNLIG